MRCLLWANAIRPYTLAAGFVLAMVFTFSCSSGGGGGGSHDDDSSSSAGGVAGVSSSSAGGTNRSSSSGGDLVSSSSIGDVTVSSSSSDIAVSSSSSDNAVSSSSIESVVVSSSSVGGVVSSSSACVESWSVTTTATCIDAGVETEACTGTTRAKAKLAWAWKVTTPATPTTVGVETETCPNGDLSGKTRPLLPKCGTLEYDPATKFCQSPGVVKDLCGTATYTATQFCYNNSKVGNLCGNNPQQSYNPNLYECKQNSNGIYLKNGITDSRDNNKHYEAVLIGTQTWMAENLNYAASGSKCGSVLTGSGTVEDANTPTCDTYGRLYDWSTAMGGSASSNLNPSGVQGVCPSGWHLPSDAEWGALMQIVNPSCSPTDDCANAGTKLKANSALWSTNTGTDDFGFSALPGGYGYIGSFYDVGNRGNWWSATEDTDAYGRIMLYDDEDVYRNYGNKFDGLSSVRCLQD